MAISIKNPEAERKLRQVAKLLGKSLTATIIELADEWLRQLALHNPRKPAPSSSRR